MKKLLILPLLFLCLINYAGAFQMSPDITAQPGQVDPYRTRSELLMDAANYTGVFTPERAADVWMQGLIRRSAAMQYTVMTEKLKKEYAGQLDALRSNWVTGMSSPSVQGYKLTGNFKPDDTHAEISLKIETASASTPPDYYNAKLRIVNEGGFWRIERIWTDKELYPYTLYRP